MLRQSFQYVTMYQNKANINTIWFYSFLNNSHQNMYAFREDMEESP